MKLQRAFVVMVLSIAGCGGTSPPAHVEISGMTPEAGAAVAAHAVCTREAECGEVSIICSSAGTAGGAGSSSAPTTSCSAQIAPVVYDKCFMDASPDLAKLLACPALTPADVDTLETCFDMLIAEPCVTQAQADAQAQAAQSGTEPSAHDVPAACALLVTPPAGC